MKIRELHIIIILIIVSIYPYSITNSTELFYSSFIGGNNIDEALGIDLDTSGNIYITGRTISPNFPTIAGAIDSTLSGNYDIFITKFNSSGTSLIYSTLLGNSGDDAGNGIKVDLDGYAYIVGQTLGSSFPVTSGAFDTTFNGGNDVILFKLNTTGTALVYSTFLGGGDGDVGYGIAIDSAGNAYITGLTRGQTGSPFPTTPGAFDTTTNSQENAFVAKFNPTGSTLLYSTFLGGSNEERGLAIAVDTGGNAFVTGFTQSLNIPLNDNFPITLGAYDSTYNGFGGESSNGRDAFITKLNPTGTDLIYSTYLGGGYQEYGQGITIDSNGNAYVTGFTTSSTDFPVTTNAFQTTHQGGMESFITKINSSGSALLFSTFLGGTGTDEGNSIYLDNSGNLYIVGLTSSSTDFPLSTNSMYTTYQGGSTDIFLTKLSPDGTTLLYSGLFGGEGNDEGIAVTGSPSGLIYLTGFTQSSTYSTSTSAYDTTFNGIQDAFLTILDIGAMVPVEISLFTAQPDDNVPVNKEESILEYFLE